MLLAALLMFVSFHLNRIWANGHCIDIHSQVVSQGLHYVPGPNTCILCICDKGSPKWCKSVLCAPPQNCKSFQVGSTCCEFKCLDDILTTDSYKNTYDLALRLIASGVTAVLSLSLLFFLFHRLRRRKIRLRHQNRQITEDQRSLNSIGYIAGSLGYLPGSLGYLRPGSNDLEFHYEEASPHYSLWKPPGNYFPRGEAPPPYEEAVRSAQAEHDALNNQIRNNNNNTANSQSNSTNSIPYSSRLVQDTSSQPQQNSSCALLTRSDNCNATSDISNREYVNVPFVNPNIHHNPSRNTVNVINLGNGSRNRHSLQEAAKKNIDNANKSKSYENIVTVKNDVTTAKTPELRRTIVQNKHHKYENLPYNTPQTSHVPSTSHIQAQIDNKSTERTKLALLNNHLAMGRHRTIPNKDIIIEVPKKLLSENPIVRELEKPIHDNIIKQTTNLKTNPSTAYQRITLTRKRELNPQSSNSNFNYTQESKSEYDVAHRSLPKHLKNYNYPISIIKHNIPTEINLKSTCGELPTTPSTSFQLTPLMSKSEDQLKTSPKPEDKSYILYHSLSLSQDDDDYRSECENCKSSGLTNNMNDEDGDIINETMTLQRRPLEQREEVPYYRTSVTLPTNIRKPR